MSETQKRVGGELTKKKGGNWLNWGEDVWKRASEMPPFYSAPNPAAILLRSVQKLTETQMHMAGK